MTAGHTAVLELPAEITADLEAILGKMCFEFIHIARLFRASGVAIKTRAEAEQAHCLYYLLRMHALHGAGWREAANADLRAMHEAALIKASPTAPERAGHGQGQDRRGGT